MARFPGDQGIQPTEPRDPRESHDQSGALPGRAATGAFGGQPPAPPPGSPGHQPIPQPPQAYGATAQSIQPERAPRPEGSTTGFRENAQFQLAPSTRLQDGRYVIESVIGKGGMGHVYRGIDTHLGRIRAIKEMIPQMGGAEAALMNYDREAEVMLRQEHPGIPQIFDRFVEGRRAYIVIQFIEGENLEQRLNNTNGFLSQEVVGDWMLQLCQIVGHLHTQNPPVIFRDIKPNNIIITPDNRIVLIDFGIAKSFYEGEQHTNVGTNGYAAKEMYMRQAEPRSDIFSIGATMHHLLTRSDPRAFAPLTFHERPPRKLNPAISEPMEAVIMKCVANDARDRYQNCDELARAIESALGLAPVDDTGTYRATRPATGGPRRATWSPAPGPTTSLGNGAEILWSFATEDEVRSTPSVSADTVYVGSYDNNLYALDRRTGAWKWQFPTQGGVVSKPALWRDLVIFGSEDYHVYAVNAQTGTEVWRYRTWRPVRSSPRVFNDIVYVGSDDGNIYAIDPRTGSVIWKYATYREVASSAAYSSGIVYFGSRDDYVYAVDAVAGEKKWSFRTSGPVISTPCVSDDHVFVGSSDFAVYCLEAQSGWRAWDTRTEKFVISSPVIAGDLLYVGSTDNHLYCLNHRTGRLQWRYRTGNQLNSTPFVADDVVYFGSNDRSVYGLDTATGMLRWRFETAGIVPGSPVVDQGVVYIGSGDNRIYALRAAMPS